MLEVILIVVLACIIGWRIIEMRDDKAAEQRRRAKEAAERENREMIRKRIKAGQKYSEFCNFINSVPANGIAEIGESWHCTENSSDWFTGIYVIFSDSAIRYKEDTSLGTWEFDGTLNYYRRSFFSINSGERKWTSEESRIVVDLVNSYIVSKSSLNLERGKTRRYLPNMQSPDDTVLWTLKAPSKTAAIKSPY